MVIKGKLLLFGLSISLSFSSFSMDVNSSDFHSMLDMDLNSSAFLESTKTIKESIDDKNLAPLVVIINRAPKGSAADAQRAKIYVEGVLYDTVKVSTGKIGYESRLGYFRPVYTNHLRVYDSYYSGKYGSLMDKAIFYSGGYAIHHTGAVNKLGSRASHGCVRFHIEDIAQINDMAIQLGSTEYKMRKWSHSAHKGRNRYNVHYKGLETIVPPVNRYTGVIDYTKGTKSLDMVILVKDQRDTDK